MPRHSTTIGTVRGTSESTRESTRESTSVSTSASKSTPAWSILPAISVLLVLQLQPTVQALHCFQAPVPSQVSIRERTNARSDSMLCGKVQTRVRPSALHAFDCSSSCNSRLEYVVRALASYATAAIVLTACAGSALAKDSDALIGRVIIHAQRVMAQRFELITCAQCLYIQAE
jgi:hypothetical protein